MKFSALDLPESNAELASWFEDHLTGIDLADVVAGLEVFRHERTQGPALAELLGRQQAEVLEHGLGALSEEQLIQLLRHPRLLLPLQETVLTRGGAYWQNRPLSAAHRQLIEQGWTALEADTRTNLPTARPVKPATNLNGGGISSRRTPWMALTAAAAIVMIALIGNSLKPASEPSIASGTDDTQPAGAGDATAPEVKAPELASSGWGWDRPGALDADIPAPQYLEQLANGANDWFKKRPEDPEGIKTRLEQFRHGCDTLIAASHPPLAVEDQAWLKERCTAWRGKIDEHLAALEAGTSPLEVREAADVTVNRLITALRERATTIAVTPHQSHDHQGVVRTDVNNRNGFSTSETLFTLPKRIEFRT